MSFSLQLFAVMYGIVGRFADLVMVNSSWTERHINHLWTIPTRTWYSHVIPFPRTCFYLYFSRPVICLFSF